MVYAPCSIASYDTRPHASARKGFRDAFKDVRQVATLLPCGGQVLPPQYSTTLAICLPQLLPGNPQSVMDR